MTLPTDGILPALLQPDHLLRVLALVSAVLDPAVELDDYPFDEGVDSRNDLPRCIGDLLLGLNLQPGVVEDQPHARLADRLGLAIHVRDSVERSSSALVHGEQSNLGIEVVERHEFPMEGGIPGDHGAVATLGDGRAHHRPRDGRDQHAAHHLGRDLPAGMNPQIGPVNPLSDSAEQVDPIEAGSPQRQPMQCQRRMVTHHVVGPGPANGQHSQPVTLIAIRGLPLTPTDVGAATHADQLSFSNAGPQVAVCNAASMGLGSGEDSVLCPSQSMKSRIHDSRVGGMRLTRKGAAHSCGRSVRSAPLVGDADTPKTS